MARDFRIETTYKDDGTPRFKVVNTKFKASDVRMSKRRANTKPPEVKPRPYLSLITKAVNLRKYLQVRPALVPVDDTSGWLFSVYTAGGCRGANFVDSWGEVEPEHPRTGFACLVSARTHCRLWVSRHDNFEWNAVAEIMRATGVRHPPRYI